MYVKNALKSRSNGCFAFIHFIIYKRALYSVLSVVQRRMRIFFRSFVVNLFVTCFLNPFPNLWGDQVVFGPNGMEYKTIENTRIIRNKILHMDWDK